QRPDQRHQAAVQHHRLRHQGQRNRKARPHLLQPRRVAQALVSARGGDAQRHERTRALRLSCSS
ncbi:hypothetical protein EMIHUDRAFT_460878, partial [Emiliania huxleyi CCMP1516]|uniref:Uncharacterized protein n=2 Tax=Emiliania huxleyi TaxID=2903 RepID=A0A0D3I367_EMIH1